MVQHDILLKGIDTIRKYAAIQYTLTLELFVSELASAHNGAMIPKTSDPALNSNFVCKLLGCCIVDLNRLSILLFVITIAPFSVAYKLYQIKIQLQRIKDFSNKMCYSFNEFFFNSTKNTSILLT